MSCCRFRKSSYANNAASLNRLTSTSLYLTRCWICSPLCNRCNICDAATKCPQRSSSPPHHLQILKLKVPSLSLGSAATNNGWENIINNGRGLKQQAIYVQRTWFYAEQVLTLAKQQLNDENIAFYIKGSGFGHCFHSCVIGWTTQVATPA